MCVCVFVHRNQAEIARLLLSKGASVNLLNNSMCTALHIAVNKGFTDVVKVLTEHSADVNLQVHTHTGAHKQSHCAFGAVMRVWKTVLFGFRLIEELCKVICLISPPFHMSACVYFCLAPPFLISTSTEKQKGLTQLGDLSSHATLSVAYLHH